MAGTANLNLLIFILPIVPTLAVLFLLFRKMQTKAKNRKIRSYTAAFLQGAIGFTAIATVLLSAISVNDYFHQSPEERRRDTWFEPGSVFAPVTIPLFSFLIFIVGCGPGGTTGLVVANICQRSRDPIENSPVEGQDTKTLNALSSKPNYKLAGELKALCVFGWVCFSGWLWLIFACS